MGAPQKAPRWFQEDKTADAVPWTEYSGLYRHYADDVVEYFVQKSVANGIDIIRIFDCLNDIRNLETAVKAANKEKAHAQIALSYTLGDAYTLDYWKDIAKRIEDMGADSICIKDMAGLLAPYEAETSL